MTTHTAAIVLPSGYTLIRVSSEQWAQIPPDFDGPTIPDEYLFHPSWSREAVNAAWKAIRSDVITSRQARLQ